MHIVSSVQGVLRPGLSPLDAFRSVFPAGTVSGAPKIMACKHIYTREKQRRGLYAGALGWVGFGGEALDFCIAIRTLLFLGPKRCFAQAGGGIVLDSNEEDEYQETLAKMAGVMAAVKGAEKRLCQDSGEEHAEAESDAARRHRAVCVQGGKKESWEKKEASSKGSKELVKNAVLLVDNYDSFTYNLYQLLSREHVVNVVRNDQVTVEQLMDSQVSFVKVMLFFCFIAQPRHSRRTLFWGLVLVLLRKLEFVQMSFGRSRAKSLFSVFVWAWRSWWR